MLRLLRKKSSNKYFRHRFCRIPLRNCGSLDASPVSCRQEIFVIYITIYSHLLLAFSGPHPIGCLRALVIELDAVEDLPYLSASPSPSLSMINQRANKFLACFCFVLTKQQQQQQNGTRVFGLTQLKPFVFWNGTLVSVLFFQEPLGFINCHLFCFKRFA